MIPDSGKRKTLVMWSGGLDSTDGSACIAQGLIGALRFRPGTW